MPIIIYHKSLSEAERLEDPVIKDTSLTDDTLSYISIEESGVTLPISYIVDKIHAMGPKLFNNPHHASCVLRVMCDIKLDKTTWDTVTPQDQFYWIHDLALTSQSKAFTTMFASKPSSSSSSSSSSSPTTQKTKAPSPIPYKWQSLSTTPTRKPRIETYPSPTTSPSFPLLSIRVTCPSIFPELLYWLYTGDDERWMRAILANGPVDAVVADVEALGIDDRFKRIEASCREMEKTKGVQTKHE
ncbi:uncharacterized protein SPPG_02870 [Spizellomyces punctatus DAOM BR117]|uniref:Uncharacterized protein n=1 Tax=Spizellomyces punctatus (strain DAOM BR117) TaxID=645134 RepID=A0A0L0HMU9_SPIPD|nr:uncharacterized protein SPPG_02870 [Spizellomyces punctatus DAOM BR117]KND02403.1 hypothetical protein SPPG_02870 [Spizellomyces punctatus DAOM BR117]|eukprot:XP_016610442.1 hypothetical protein SPPG_02870 [Spizellomyces punctatus DAOM BR117]